MIVGNSDLSDRQQRRGVDDAAVKGARRRHPQGVGRRPHVRPGQRKQGHIWLRYSALPLEALPIFSMNLEMFVDLEASCASLPLGPSQWLHKV